MRVLISYDENGERKVDGEFTNYHDVAAHIEKVRERGITDVKLTRVDLVCDFCSEPEVVVVFQLAPGGEIAPGHMDDDGKWGACSVCRDLISGGVENIGRLGVRSFENMVKLHPADAVRMTADEIAMMIAIPHSYFWTRYDGSAPERVVSDEELMNS